MDTKLNTEEEYYVRQADWVNNEYYIRKKGSKKDVLSYMINELLKDSIVEHKNKLYWVWGEICYDEDNELFRDYDTSKPKTKKELNKYIEDGNILKLCWSTRAPVSFALCTKNKDLLKPIIQKYVDDRNKFAKALYATYDSYHSEKN